MYTVCFQAEREWLTAHAVFPFMVSLAFFSSSFFSGNFPYMGKICKNICYKVFAIISFVLLPSSHFNLQVYFRLFCQTTIVEMFSLIRKEKVKIVVPTLQETVLYGTRRVVLLVHCIVLTVPISPQNPKVIWITILLRSIAPHNLISLSSVNAVIMSFHDFTQYVNRETLNTECKSDQEQEMWMWNILWEMLRIRDWEKSCVPVNISWRIRNLKERDTKYSITQWKLSTKQSSTRNLITFSTIWSVQQKWIWLLASIWKI